MNKGRAKCNRIKAIRKAVADKIGVDLHQTECTFDGQCTGTCPKCKQEEQILNRALLGRVAGLTAGAVLATSLTACGINKPVPIEVTPGNLETPVDRLDGNVEIMVDTPDNELDTEYDKDDKQVEEDNTKGNTWKNHEPLEGDVEINIED